MNKFHEKYNLPNSKHDKTEILNSPTSLKQTEFLSKKTTSPDGFIGEFFYQHSKRNNTNLMQILFFRKQRRNTSQLILRSA